MIKELAGVSPPSDEVCDPEEDVVGLSCPSSVPVAYAAIAAVHIKLTAKITEISLKKNLFSTAIPPFISTLFPNKSFCAQACRSKRICRRDFLAQAAGNAM